MGKLTVEALPQAGTVRGRTAGIAFRQHWNAVPVCVIDPGDIGASLDLLLKAIAQISQSRACGALLFITDDMNAYVLNEERTTAQDWIRERFRTMVGLYSYRPRHGLTPDRGGMGEDIAEHLVDLARVPR